MKCLVFGHSYCRDLNNLGVKSFNTEFVGTVEFKYTYFPGACYSKFVRNTDLLLESIEYKPDIVVVILGGNDILKHVDNNEIFYHCRQFYQFLRNSLPEAIIIASQVELRFNSELNRFNAPTAEKFKHRRNQLNRFIQRLKCKNNMLLIAGPGRLDHECYYRDGIHLNSAGLRLYMGMLKSTIAYSIRQRFRN